MINEKKQMKKSMKLFENKTMCSYEDIEQEISNEAKLLFVSTAKGTTVIGKMSSEDLEKLRYKAGKIGDVCFARNKELIKVKDYENEGKE